MSTSLQRVARLLSTWKLSSIKMFKIMNGDLRTAAKIKARNCNRVFEWPSNRPTLIMICSLYTFPVSKQYHLELVTSRSNLDSIFPIIQPAILFPFRHKECLRTSSTVGGLWRKQEAIWCQATLLTWTGAVIITTFGEIWCVLCFQIERKIQPVEALGQRRQ